MLTAMLEEGLLRGVGVSLTHVYGGLSLASDARGQPDQCANSGRVCQEARPCQQ
jgi:hypothetical protein